MCFLSGNFFVSSFIKCCMNNFVLILKGFLIGIAKIIPGVSGAILAISLGIYERILRIIGHPLKINFEDIKFLFFLFFGAILGILVFSWGIMWCLDMWKLATMLLFIGFIIGGIPEITSEMKGNFCLKNILICIISFVLILFLTNLSSSSGSSNHYFLMGSIESLTTIIPGISGTAIFMALGWYESVLETINGILTFSAPLSVSFNYLLGFIVSTIFIARVLGFLFDKYKASSYFGVMGFMIGSLVTMILDLFCVSCGFWEKIIGVLLFFTGLFSTSKINSFFSNF